MNRKGRLGLLRLEERITPAAFGIPWADARNVTLSFVADGTDVLGESSNLFASLAGDGLSTSQWQGQILRGFQAWASQANVNIGVVTDDGSAIGVAGSPQGDPRFGDIRISMRALDGNVLAITTPPGNNGDTLAGDIIFNSNYDFAIGNAPNKFDLFTATLQEAGHAFGLGNTSDTSSVMYEWYNGTRQGLGANDGSALRVMYGSRPLDGFEGYMGNQSPGSATVLPSVSGTTTRYARADITNTGDADTYKFTTPASLSGPVSVKLRTAGLSLLQGSVMLHNGMGQTFAAGIATGPGGDVTVSATLAANAQYYVSVTPLSGSAFSVGGYKLSVVFDPYAADPGTAAAPPVVYAEDGGTNDTLATATALTADAGSASLRHYAATAKLESAGDVDYYKVAAPPQISHLIVTVRAADGGAVPEATFTTASGGAVTAVDISTSDNTRVYQIEMVAGGSTIAVKVVGPGALYRLTADYVAIKVTMPVVSSGILSTTTPDAYGTLTVTMPQIYSFNMQSYSLGAGSPAALTILLYDHATQELVSSWTAAVGDTETHQLLLEAGVYDLKVYADFDAGAAGVAFSLRLLDLSDPIGVPLAGPPGSPPPAVPPSWWTWYQYGSTYYDWLRPKR